METGTECPGPDTMVTAEDDDVSDKSIVSDDLKILEMTTPELELGKDPPELDHDGSIQEPINWTVENDKMAARMTLRLRTLKENCDRFGLSSASNDSLHRPNPWEFLINRQYGLVWCNVFKAASSSWLFNFNVLAG
ncbi:uncharacterized protein LOC103520631 [Diaphorina citri]|uniref:Uncharacterized protein LOC103520631 n=1 Tax=Diaphorina citri TaxID=121845 RepID=A0A3Q0JGF0_DIACI|nr:uncharacterized protein LOC103520631 [Diaphorina citri]